MLGVTVGPAAVDVQKGGPGYPFVADVRVSDGASQAVLWSVEGSSPAGSSSINPTTGVLTVGPGETAGSLQVRAVSTVDPGKQGTAAVFVTTVPSATGMQALMNGRYYRTVEAAIADSAGTDKDHPEEIIILQDINITSAYFLSPLAIYTSGKHVKLTVQVNDQGKTIMVRDRLRNGFIAVVAGSSLTLAGNGTGALIFDGQNMDVGQSMVSLGYDSDLIMEAGVEIINGNASTSIIDINGGTFVMRGGKIHDNWCGAIDNQFYDFTDTNGTVYISNNGTFEMKGGEIYDNTNRSFMLSTYPVVSIATAGAGVTVRGSGTFKMEGGSIYRNTAYGYGGGVVLINYPQSSEEVETTFIKTGGTITGGNDSNANRELAHPSNSYFPFPGVPRGNAVYGVMRRYVWNPAGTNPRDSQPTGGFEETYPSIIRTGTADETDNLRRVLTAKDKLYEWSIPYDENHGDELYPFTDVAEGVWN